MLTFSYIPRGVTLTTTKAFLSFCGFVIKLFPCFVFFKTVFKTISSNLKFIYKKVCTHIPSSHFKTSWQRYKLCKGLQTDTRFEKKGLK